MASSKTCRECGKEFTSHHKLRAVCSSFCQNQRDYQQRKAKEEKSSKGTIKLSKEPKRKVTRGKLLQRTQETFNAYIRARDDGIPCIACGCLEAPVWHAGHYRSVGSCGTLRFNEENCHKQCIRCNVFLHGNLIYYRKGLIYRLGVKKVELLEGWHEPVKLSISDIQDIRAKYQAKLKTFKTL